MPCPQSSTDSFTWHITDYKGRPTRNRVHFWNNVRGESAPFNPFGCLDQGFYTCPRLNPHHPLHGEIV